MRVNINIIVEAFSKHYLVQYMSDSLRLFHLGCHQFLTLEAYNIRDIEC